ncbi:GTPase activating protein for Arf protein [Ceratobasidium sp. AG-Ba]|nr:GTPase activating protein for Arf protein [Ceratobasidium sp. AG-Ba]QRV91786.1 GTPase activating protein for Arf protein [Ceratobasidium sp. AG-Ba]
MSRQDRQTTERNTRTLRELVKRPENKVCADCKKNDPRWASWNIGVFICIRCSGIHRSMGTHISKVKSVDLDVWTPEQMASIQKWGNERANLYWEAHLKAGHQPPDHKMESFIRSKYESRRWAMEGPPPSDPSVLGGGSVAAPEPAPVPQAEPVSSPTLPAPQPTSRPVQQHNLLSSSLASRTSRPAGPQASQPQVAAPVAPAPAPAAPQNDLFSLDFHAPTPPAQPQAPKNNKSDILSLYSSGSNSASSGFGGFGQQPAPASGMPQPTSMAGTTGTGMWGVQSGWAPPVQAQPASNDIWGSFGSAPQQSASQPASLFGAQDPWGSQAPKPAAQAADPFGGNVWGGSTAGASGTGGNDLFAQPFSAAPAKKDDAFGDLWGGFK